MAASAKWPLQGQRTEPEVPHIYPFYVDEAVAGEKEEADVPPNLICFDKSTHRNKEHLTKISCCIYCSVKPLCNPFSAIMIP